MHRVTNQHVRSSGIGGELNVLLNSAVLGCPALQEGQRPIVLLLHAVVLVDDLRVDVGDYVDGVLLCQALRGERDLEVDILRRDGGQSQGHHSPASWTIWHSWLMLALIASMGLAYSQPILRLG